DRLRAHPGDKEGIVADILSDRPLRNERARGAVDRVRRAHHLPELVDLPSFGIAQTKEIISLGKIAKHTRYVARDFRTQPEPAFVTTSNRLMEERFERMRLHLHRGPR